MVSSTTIYTMHTCSPLGFYFATASFDRTARIWSTDHTQPLRILAGHYNDVQVSHLCSSCNLTLRIFVVSQVSP